MPDVRLYGAFTKVEELEDGTLQVEGVASSEARDNDGEVILADAVAKAIPDYMRFGGTGPLREMHQLRAAGRTLACDVAEDKKTYVTAKVVDRDAVQKVKEGVYVGFSLGGKALKRNTDDPTVIEEMKLTEISLVDRPANPDAVISIWKADAMPEKTPAAERPFTKVSAIVQRFSKGKVTLDEAEKQVLDVLKAAPKPAADLIRKGMFQVRWAADLCEQIDSLARSTAFEAEYEGDASPVPAKLRALCADFCDVLRALVDEECAEMMEGTEVSAEAAIEAAAKPGTLMKSERVAAIGRALLESTKKEQPMATTPAAPVAKAAAVLSDEHKAALAEMHDHVKECNKRLGKVHKALKTMRGEADGDGDEKDAAATPGDVQKAADLQKTVEAAVAKAVEPFKAEIAKRDEVIEKADAALKSLLDERQKLQDEIQRRPKGALRSVPISKAEDNGTAKGAGEKSDQDLQKVASDPNLSSAEREAARLDLVKRAQKKPIAVP